MTTTPKITAKTQAAAFKNFKTQAVNIQKQNDLIDAYIAICQAYSAHKIRQPSSPSFATT